MSLSCYIFVLILFTCVLILLASSMFVLRILCTYYTALFFAIIAALIAALSQLCRSLLGNRRRSATILRKYNKYNKYKYKYNRSRVCHWCSSVAALLQLPSQKPPEQTVSILSNQNTLWPPSSISGVGSVLQVSSRPALLQVPRACPHAAVMLYFWRWQCLQVSGSFQLPLLQLCCSSVAAPLRWQFVAGLC
jgi:hypothetical protein